jgi:hypothetical protein
MKTSLMLVSAVVLCALATGCANVNLARRGSCSSCTSKAGPGCNQMACSGVASTGPAGVAATPGDPGAVAGTPGPYDPGMVGGYGGPGGYGGGGFGGRGGHFGRGGGDMGTGAGYGGPPSAHVAYPYYTTRGPRDFLMNNPPSIGY